MNECLIFFCKKIALCSCVTQTLCIFAKSFTRESGNKTIHAMKQTHQNTLQFLKLLCDGHSHSVTELMEKMGVSRHTIYNYIEAFEEEGFVIDKNNGHPHLVRTSPGGVDLRHLVHFTAEEGQLLSQLIQSLDGTNPLKQQLQRKLRAFFVSTHLPILIDDKDADSKVRVLADGMERKCQVVLRNYHSGHSNSVEDRLVEPVQFSANYRQLYAYDAHKQSMRTFVVNRMEGVELTSEPYAFEARHEVPESDCFWMGGEVVEMVTLQLDELALSLLHEEYPLSQQYKVRTSDAESSVTFPVRSLQGVGRFVLGLPGHCKVLRGKQLKAYIKEQQLIKS